MATRNEKDHEECQEFVPYCVHRKSSEVSSNVRLLCPKLDRAQLDFVGQLRVSQILQWNWFAQAVRNVASFSIQFQ